MKAKRKPNDEDNFAGWRVLILATPPSDASVICFSLVTLIVKNDMYLHYNICGRQLVEP